MTYACALEAVIASHKTARAHAEIVTAAHSRYLIRNDDGSLVRSINTNEPIETDDIGYAMSALYNAGGNGARIIERWNWRKQS